MREAPGHHPGDVQDGLHPAPAGELPEVALIQLPTYPDERGSLSVIEAGGPVAFEIRRVFYIHGVPEGATRASHSVGRVDEVLIAVSGTIEVETFDGLESRRFMLDRPDQGLFIPGHVWRKLSGFSPDAVCLVLASQTYAESDYRPFSVKPPSD